MQIGKKINYKVKGAYDRIQRKKEKNLDYINKV